MISLFRPTFHWCFLGFLVGGLVMNTGCKPAVTMEGAQGFAADREKVPPKDTPKEKGDQFAADRDPGLKMIKFDGDRAIGYLQDLCKIGPRWSGTEEMKKQQDLLEKHFTGLGGKVELQKFEGKQTSRDRVVPMANMIITWHPEAKRRVIFCGHYDTRPIADQEARKADWNKPFVSANDGTSTVALLMELAHHMKDLPLHIGIDFVIFDGEEYIFDRDRDRYFLGSTAFADHYARERQKDRDKKHTYIAAILLDLFAAKDAEFRYEINSMLLAGDVVEDVWKEAKRQGVKSFIAERGYEVQDDHLALNRIAKIPAIDIIDFGYPHWHKLSDTPDQCSGEKMAEVAKVLTCWIQRLK